MALFSLQSGKKKVDSLTEASIIKSITKCTNEAVEKSTNEITQTILRNGGISRSLATHQHNANMSKHEETKAFVGGKINEMNRNVKQLSERFEEQCRVL